MRIVTLSVVEGPIDLRMIEKRFQVLRPFDYAQGDIISLIKYDFWVKNKIAQGMWNTNNRG